MAVKWCLADLGCIDALYRRLFAIDLLAEVNSNDSLGGPLRGDSTVASPRLRCGTVGCHQQACKATSTACSTAHGIVYSRLRLAVRHAWRWNVTTA